MRHRTTSTLRLASLPVAAAAAALLLPGCVDLGKDGDGDDTGGEDDAGLLVDPALHECQPVVAESLSGVISLSMTHAHEELTDFAAPADRLSGLLTFSLVSPRSDDDLVTMGLTLEHPSLSTFQTELDVGPAEGVALAGVAAPGEVLVMGLAEWGRGTDAPAQYPAEAAWTWVEYADCYEPNDVAAQAKHLPTGVEHSAWMVSTLGESGEPTDWYRFTIAEDSVVRIQLRFAETIPMWVELFAADRLEEERLFTVSFPEVPGAFDWSSDGALPAGTYSLRLAPFVEVAVYDTPLRSEAPHLSAPYTVRIDAEPAR